MKKPLWIAALTVLLASCNNLGNDGAITIDGSSTVFPLTSAVAEAYRDVAPELRITIGISGTGGGFQKFSSGKLDIANASRPIKKEEIILAEQNNIHYLQLEVAYDGLAVVVNPENDWVDSITIQELKTIWEPAAQGKITHWNDINSDWPNEELHLFGPGVASGTFDYFTEAVVGESGASRGDFTASEDDNVLVQGVSGDKFGMGFFGLAFYESNSDILKLVAVDNGNGAVLPTRETIKTGEYEPLARPLYIYVNSKSINNPEVVDFVRFYLRNVDEVVKDVGYIALAETEYQEQLDKFNAFVEKHQSNKQAAQNVKNNSQKLQ